MKTLCKLLIFSLILFLTSSCFFDGIKGNRQVITEQRNISSDFIAIDASQGIDVYLTTGDRTALRVEADENLHDIIITEVKDGTLHIYSDKNIWSAKSRKVFVTAQSINEIHADSGAEIRSENTIKAEDLRVSATSGSDLRLDLNVTNLNCKTSSGADARLRGKAVNFTASSTSGSDIKAQDLQAEICKVKVTSGADAYVNVSERLEANATSGGDIKYIGNPKSISENASASGSISGKRHS